MHRVQHGPAVQDLRRGRQQRRVIIRSSMNATQRSGSRFSSTLLAALAGASIAFGCGSSAPGGGGGAGGAAGRGGGGGRGGTTGAAGVTGTAGTTGTAGAAGNG